VLQPDTGWRALGLTGAAIVICYGYLGRALLLRCYETWSARRVRTSLVSAAITGVAIGAVIAINEHRLPSGAITLSLDWYGYAVLGLLIAKLILSAFARPVRATAAVRERVERLRTAAVVTCHNEDPAAFTRCLESLLAQTCLPDMVTVVDDGSSAPDCAHIARSFAAAAGRAGIDCQFVLFPRNFGKRAGLAAGFARGATADVYVCIDSDTILHPAAIDRALRPFASRHVMAVTGCVLAANRGRNLLTRLIDLRYAYAFLGERAAYSALGSVLCCCGSLALYRGYVVRKYLPDFLGQTFLGKPATYGDDRRLTAYCLREGRVVLAPDAVAWTLVPDRLSHFLRQQLRWSKSFLRESLDMLRTCRPNRPCWWLALLEIATWSGFTSGLIYALVVRPALTGHLAPFTYLACIAFLAYARSGHYARAEHPGLSWRGRWFTLAIAPLYGLVSLVLLLPLRAVALATLRDNRWGTRTKVEVAG
jgi:hyaluronan synthase